MYKSFRVAMCSVWETLCVHVANRYYVFSLVYLPVAFPPSTPPLPLPLGLSLLQQLSLFLHLSPHIMQLGPRELFFCSEVTHGCLSRSYLLFQSLEFLTERLTGSLKRREGLLLLLNSCLKLSLLLLQKMFCFLSVGSA